MGAAADARVQDRDFLFIRVHGRRPVAARQRSGPRGVVPDRRGDLHRKLSAGKDDHPESEETHWRSAGGPNMRSRNKTRSQKPEARSRNSLLLACGLWLLASCLILGFRSFPAFAQAIYAENQIPARGVNIEYTVTMKTPSSHLYDVEMSIKGIREA